MKTTYYSYIHFSFFIYHKMKYDVFKYQHRYCVTIFFLPKKLSVQIKLNST